eukprot:5423665-Alexandrium_andersonii.AAC.1
MTDYWKGFRFTPKYDAFTGERKSWQCACWLPGHKDPLRPQSECTRTLSFQNSDGEEMVLRRLKQWALDG